MKKLIAVAALALVAASAIARPTDRELKIEIIGRYLQPCFRAFAEHTPLRDELVRFMDGEPAEIVDDVMANEIAGESVQWAMDVFLTKSILYLDNRKGDEVAAAYRRQFYRRQVDDCRKPDEPDD